jgi:hypothetical protein
MSRLAAALVWGGIALTLALWVALLILGANLLT